MGEAERAYLRMAARQYGVLSRAQALACGLSEDEIQGRLERGAWVRRLPSVYRLMGSPPGWMQELMAAVLWAGPGAAVSHRAAAALWKMDGFSPEGVELSAPHQLRAEPGIIVHRTGRLDRKDVVWIARLPATGAARTLLDLGAVVDPERVEEALECCLRRGWVTAARLRGRLSELGGRGRGGTATLRHLLELRDPATRPTESLLETRLLRLIGRAGLPEPVRQFEVRLGTGRKVRLDFAYPSARLAVEADGAQHHLRRETWESDHVRRNALAALGWTCLVVTWARLEAEPEEVAATLRAALTGRTL